jgi:hypothetical protein
VVDAEALVATMNRNLAQCGAPSEADFPAASAAPFIMAV